MTGRITRAAAAKQALDGKVMDRPKDFVTKGPLHHHIEKATIREATLKGKVAHSTLNDLPRQKAHPSPQIKNESTASDDEDGLKSTTSAPTTTGKRSCDVNDLPHGLGDIPSLGDFPVKKPRIARAAKKSVKQEELAVSQPTEVSKAQKRTPKTNYGIALGVTPYPDFARPTPEECREVLRLLSSLHGPVKTPKSIPEPSLTRAGCGEVPAVLDALIRTLISQNVTMHNAGMALAGIVQKFGTIKEGIGKGSIDYNKIRLAPQEELEEAIKRLGCQKTKSRQIKNVLQMVWEENQARKAALQSSAPVPGSEDEAPESKEAEIAKGEQDVLSLDHLHLLSTEEAFDTFLKFPGIGVKTAACVALFCLRRPVFAIDTHCYRLAQWLGWVPTAEDIKTANLRAASKKDRLAPINRDTAFAHLDVRVPDELKYALHKLFITHGKNCPRCRAITSDKSEGWEKGCVIDHLVKRTGERKGGVAVEKEKTKAVVRTTVNRSKGNTRKALVTRKKTSRKVKEEENSDAESSDLSDAPSDSDYE